ncbi:MAG TPA: hypothetical protein VEI74_14215 [Candidatus Methylomirabilis sp.]|nr:hypothetical protein [Candidatus Methylomirabilis sp.]
MTGHYTPQEIAAQLKDVHARGKCQHEEKRADASRLVQADIAKLICTVIDYFSHVVIKRGELALVIGTRGDLRSLTVTLELIRHRQRVAYLSYSDRLLRIEDRGRRNCMAERQGRNTLRIHGCEGSLPSLVTMRALLYTKLPTKGRVLTPPSD